MNYLVHTCTRKPTPSRPTSNIFELPDRLSTRRHIPLPALARGKTISTLMRREDRRAFPQRAVKPLFLRLRTLANRISRVIYSGFCLYTFLLFLLRNSIHQSDFRLVRICPPLFIFPASFFLADFPRFILRITGSNKSLRALKAVSRSCFISSQFDARVK